MTNHSARTVKLYLVCTFMWCLFGIHVTNVLTFLHVSCFPVTPPSLFSRSCLISQLTAFSSLSVFLNPFNRRSLIRAAKCSGSLVMLYSRQRIIPRFVTGAAAGAVATPPNQVLSTHFPITNHPTTLCSSCSSSLPCLQEPTRSFTPGRNVLAITVVIPA